MKVFVAWIVKFCKDEYFYDFVLYTFTYFYKVIQNWNSEKLLKIQVLKKKKKSVNLQVVEGNFKKIAGSSQAGDALRRKLHDNERKSWGRKGVVLWLLTY